MTNRQQKVDWCWSTMSVNYTKRFRVVEWLSVKHDLMNTYRWRKRCNKLHFWNSCMLNFYVNLSHSIFICPPLGTCGLKLPQATIFHITPEPTVEDKMGFCDLSQKCLGCKMQQKFPGCLLSVFRYLGRKPKVVKAEKLRFRDKILSGSRG